MNQTTPPIPPNHIALLVSLSLSVLEAQVVHMKTVYHL